MTKTAGNFGITQAILFNERGKEIGRCLDTPNCVAYAFGINKDVCSAKGILGLYDKKDIRSRVPQAIFDKHIHHQHVVFD